MKCLCSERLCANFDKFGTILQNVYGTSAFFYSILFYALILEPMYRVKTDQLQRFLHYSMEDFDYLVKLKVFLV